MYVTELALKHDTAIRVFYRLLCGGMAEWPMAAVLKTVG